MINKILGVSILCLLTACSSVDVLDEVPAPQAGMLSEEYKIGVRDQLQVNVWRNADLSVSVPVRPDGKISVPLAGDVVAAGKTAEALAKDVTGLLANYIRNPEVTVIISNPASSEYLQRVRITGAINAPQSLPYQQGMTVLDVVLQAGGASAFAAQNSALLYRQTEDELKVYPIYLEDILKNGNLKTNYLLAPSDIITIPERIF